MTAETPSELQAPGPAKQAGFRIKSISISLEIATKEYGSGNSGYANIQAHVDDTPIEQIADVINAGLSLYVAGWEIILGGKLAVKMNVLTPAETQQAVMTVQRRLAKVQAMLHEAHAAKDSVAA